MLIYRAVTRRLFDLGRAARRRTAAERLHQTERPAIAPAWTQPDVHLETRELAHLIDMTIAAMPDAMRRVFILVRHEELSYKEAATRLGIGVGTVHTQLSRANTLLRETIEHYRASADSPLPGAGAQPIAMTKP